MQLFACLAKRTSHAVVLCAAVSMFLGALTSASAEGPQGRWVMSTAQPRRGDRVAAWLVIQPSPSASSVVVTAGTPHEAALDITPPNNVTCQSQAANKTVVCQVPAATFSLLEFTATPHETGTLSLVAVVVQTNADGKVFSETVSSSALTVRSAVDLGPTWTAVATALFGFVAGIATQVIQRWRDSVAKARDAERDVQAKLLQTLTPEIQNNQQLLWTFVSGGAPAPHLMTNAYNTLTTSAVAYLSAAERRPYFTKLEALYTSIAVFNRKVNLNPRDPTLTADGAAIVALIAGLDQ